MCILLQIFHLKRVFLTAKNECHLPLCLWVSGLLPEPMEPDAAQVHCIHGTSSPSLPLAAALPKRLSPASFKCDFGHVTCFSQWHVSKYAAWSLEKFLLRLCLFFAPL